jgi:hypothetical protein
MFGISMLCPNHFVKVKLLDVLHSAPLCEGESQRQYLCTYAECLKSEDSRDYINKIIYTKLVFEHFKSLKHE